MPDFHQTIGEFNKSSREDQYSKDCTLEPFSRCVEPLLGGEQGLPECHDMSCTAQKQLLIDGEPCDSSAHPLTGLQTYIACAASNTGEPASAPVISVSTRAVSMSCTVHALRHVVFRLHSTICL